jgi:putative peptide zinc metalloprotease protein
VTQTVWRATAGRPPLRIAAALAGAMVLSAVAWAWWPDGQYRPLEARVDSTPEKVPRLVAYRLGAPQPFETVATMPSSAAVPQPAASAGGHWMLVLLPQDAAGTSQAGQGPTVAPSEQQPLPPGLSTGAGSGASSGWPFPFAPPRDPGPGDNQAMAVNTQDGSTAYDVALALVWVTDGGPVDNRNEAYAAASCRDCRTVAVAFQVVLVIGYAQVATPINSAVAVNYGCEGCATNALAVQLVATLARAPNARTMSELARIWAQLQAASATFELLPLEEVYTLLLAARASILELLARDEEPVAVDGSSAAAEATTVTEPSGHPALADGASAEVTIPAPPATTTTEEAPPATTTEPAAVETTATTTTTNEETGTTEADETPTTTAEEPTDTTETPTTTTTTTTP